MFLKIMYTGMDKKDRKTIWIVSVSLASLGMAHLFGSVIPVPLFFGLQMARGLYMLMYMAFIYAAYLVWTVYGSDRFSMDRGVIAVVSAAAIASGVPRFVVSGILICVILWLLSKLHDNMLRICIRMVSIMITGFIVYLSLKNYVLAVIVCTPIFLLAAAELLRKLNVMNGKPVHKWIFIYIVLMVVFVAKIHRDGSRVDFPLKLPVDTWTEVQYWAAQNTPKKSVFIVPPDTMGFRIFSKRSIVGDYKDGAPGILSETYSMEWAHRMKQLESYETLQDEDFITIAGKYKASYVVTHWGHNPGFQKVSQNDRFNVYRLQ